MGTFTPTEGALTTLATFTGTNGGNPKASLTLDSNGNLFGTTSSGGASNNGTVFKLTPAATAPEPGALLLLAPGALGLIAARRRRAGFGIGRGGPGAIALPGFFAWWVTRSARRAAR